LRDEDVVWVLKAEALSRPERNDSADRVIRRDADGHTVARHHLDTEAAHPAAQLRQHFVSCVALDAIQPAGMNGHDRSLHIYEIVLAQSAHPFTESSNECAMDNEYVQRTDVQEFAGFQPNSTSRKTAANESRAAHRWNTITMP
jgi:hypothetical protein